MQLNFNKDSIWIRYDQYQKLTKYDDQYQNNKSTTKFNDKFNDTKSIHIADKDLTYIEISNDIYNKIINHM